MAIPFAHIREKNGGQKLEKAGNNGQDKTEDPAVFMEQQLQDTLYDSYFRNSGDMFSLTEEQKANVAKTGSLQVLCVDHDAPYVYQQKGEPAGMLVSVLNDFAEEMRPPSPSLP